MKDPISQTCVEIKQLRLSLQILNLKFKIIHKLEIKQTFFCLKPAPGLTTISRAFTFERGDITVHLGEPLVHHSVVIQPLLGSRLAVRPSSCSSMTGGFPCHEYI